MTLLLVLSTVLSLFYIEYDVQILLCSFYNKSALSFYSHSRSFSSFSTLNYPVKKSLSPLIEKHAHNSEPLNP